MNRTERMRAILMQELQPIQIEVRDVSDKHIGHVGARPGGETHYEIALEAECFRNVGKVQRHQMVYRLLSEELQNGLHAVSIEARTPGE